MATFRSPTWILRDPRIGPVVTLSSVRAGASPIGLSFSLRRCQPDQVLWVPAMPPISAARLRLPREGISLGPCAGECHPLAGGGRLPRLILRDDAVLVGIDLVEGREHRGTELGLADLAVLVRIEALQGRFRIRRDPGRCRRLELG